jgi:hypothetical protein
VRYVKVAQADEVRSAYTWVTLAFVNKFDGDNIQRQENMGNERSRRSSIALENGHWVLRDGDNNIYDLH